jgi:hypothetical protein
LGSLALARSLGALTFDHLGWVLRALGHGHRFLNATGLGWRCSFRWFGPQGRLLGFELASLQRRLLGGLEALGFFGALALESLPL